MDEADLFDIIEDKPLKRLLKPSAAAEVEEEEEEFTIFVEESERLNPF